jgi:hypothetical protein
LSAGGSVSPLAAASPSSPSPRGWGQRQQQHQHTTPPQQQRSQDTSGWRSSVPVSPDTAALSTEELLSLYGAPGSAEHLQLESPMRASGGSALVRQLQEALAAAHAEKVGGGRVSWLALPVAVLKGRVPTCGQLEQVVHEGNCALRTIACVHHCLLRRTSSCLQLSQEAWVSS